MQVRFPQVIAYLPAGALTLYFVVGLLCSWVQHTDSSTASGLLPLSAHIVFVHAITGDYLVIKAGHFGGQHSSQRFALFELPVGVEVSQIDVSSVK